LIGRSRRTQPLDVHLEGDVERVRRNHDRRIRELAAAPSADAVVLQDVELVGGVRTAITHGLGRAPRMVKPSVPRGATAAGYLTEIRDGSVDRRTQILLTANGYGATIILDLEVQ